MITILAIVLSNEETVTLPPNGSSILVGFNADGKTVFSETRDRWGAYDVETKIGAQIVTAQIEGKFSDQVTTAILVNGNGAICQEYSF